MYAILPDEPMQRLVLFDIDGTLLMGNQQGKSALMQAVAPAPFNREHRISGKTDLQFIFECLEPHYGEHELTRRLPDLFDCYIAYLRESYITDNRVRLLPGVRDLLNALESHRSVCLIGLLTGNIQRGAQIKLGAVGLSDYFTLGAFGEDGRYRRQLPPVAVDRALRHCGVHFRNRDVIILGDTTNDIDCGRPLNARTIAVASGFDSHADLAAEKPDFLFHDFQDTDAVLRAILDPL